MESDQIGVIVLAAGKGTRMRSNKAKVLHEVFFAPMLHHVLNAIVPLSPQKIVIVTGHQAEAVEASLADFDVVFARQKQQIGTGNAVLAAEKLFANFTGTVLIVCGDSPLIRTETLRAMLAAHSASQAVLTVMTTEMADPANYGRIITDNQGNLLRIVEEKDASSGEKKINEVNAGIYCVQGAFLFNGSRRIGSANQQGEFYLTDLVEIARAEDLRVMRYVCDDHIEVLGINSRVDLAEAHSALQKRRNLQLMLAGVTIIGPDSVDISFEATVGPDCEIGRNVMISGASALGRACQVGAGTTIRASRIGDSVRIGSMCYLDSCEIADHRLLDPGSFVAGEERSSKVGS